MMIISPIYSFLIRQRHQLRLLYFQTALSFILSTPMDMNEVECILSNLIYKGFIKGYISHEKKILVLSKKVAFPPITEVTE